MKMIFISFAWNVNIFDPQNFELLLFERTIRIIRYKLLVSSLSDVCSFKQEITHGKRFVKNSFHQNGKIDIFLWKASSNIILVFHVVFIKKNFLIYLFVIKTLCSELIPLRE